jgi:FkbM family methyltransferase
VQLAQSKLASRLLGEHVSAIIVKTPFGLLAIDPADRGVGRHLLRTGSYADKEVERLLSLTSAQGHALVVGAHIGAVAIALAKRVAYVVAVEPNPRSFELLEISIRVNRISNLELINVAASDKIESVEMLISTANSGGSKRVPITRKAMYSYDRPRKISVPGMPLDQLFAARCFDLVVMDIEGSEYFALKGMQSVLRNCKSLAVEFLPHHLRYVSGVTVEQFLHPIWRHFDELVIPSTEIAVGRAQFMSVLTSMYQHGETDDGIIFSKSAAFAPD